ncbi:Zinc finger, MYND-type [Dillenia turbinata]|uniref:Zinc finger, MYND-type n=1 Tax=Dillenia turbinata TaxID=194707 RepID=A0AAN8YYX4_9MAGN
MVLPRGILVFTEEISREEKNDESNICLCYLSSGAADLSQSQLLTLRSIKSVPLPYILNFQNGLAPGSGTCLTKVKGIAPAFIKSLFRASAALYRTDPWKRLRPGHLFGVRVGKDSEWSGKKQPFPCIQFIGGDGGDVGIHMFRSDIGAQRMTGSRETIRFPNVELLRVTYEPESLIYPVIDVARCMPEGGLQFRNLTLEELRFVYAVMRAISLVHPLLQQDRDAAPKWSRLMCFEPFIETVDVQWPPEIAKGNVLVAVTVSHPPGQAYDEKSSSTACSTLIKYAEPLKEEVLFDAKGNYSTVLRSVLYEKEVQGDKSLCCGRCRAVVYCSYISQKQQWKETHNSICGVYKARMEREEELARKILTFPGALQVA